MEMEWIVANPASEHQLSRLRAFCMKIFYFPYTTSKFPIFETFFINCLHNLSDSIRFSERAFKAHLSIV